MSCFCYFGSVSILTCFSTVRCNFFLFFWVIKFEMICVATATWNGCQDDFGSNATLNFQVFNLPHIHHHASPAISSVIFYLHISSTYVININII